MRLNDILVELRSHHKKDRDKLFLDYFSNRLNKSLKVYIEELKLAEKYILDSTKPDMSLKEINKDE